MPRVLTPSALALSIGILSAATAWCGTASPEGWWQSIDDKTGAAKSVIHITSEKGTLSGKIEKLFRKPDQNQHPLCDVCDGARKDQPVIGMMIIWGMKPDGSAWDKGSIVDPGSGKTYKCKMEMGPDGKTLSVRGYLGFSLLGRSQTWKRIAPPDSGPAPVPAG